MHYRSKGSGDEIRISKNDSQNAIVIIAGKTIQCNIANCSFFLESNFVSLEWLFLATSMQSATTAISTQFLDVNALQRMPYNAEKLEEKNG